MDVLAGQKRPTELLLDDVAVFQRPSSALVDLDFPVEQIPSRHQATTSECLDVQQLRFGETVLLGLILGRAVSGSTASIPGKRSILPVKLGDGLPTSARTQTGLALPFQRVFPALLVPHYSVPRRG